MQQNKTYCSSRPLPRLALVSQMYLPKSVCLLFMCCATPLHNSAALCCVCVPLSCSHGTLASVQLCM
jgi:hypothetical protein